MDEGTSKAIPIRRSRATARVVAVRPQPWTPSLSAGVRAAMEPPRQLWLAALGGTVLAIRGVRTAWALMISEGALVEAQLLRTLGRGPAS
jgi:hypothetical protein